MCNCDRSEGYVCETCKRQLATGFACGCAGFLKSLMEQRAALVTALRKLLAEVTDSTIVAVREGRSNINAQVLLVRRDEAHAVLDGIMGKE